MVLVARERAAAAGSLSGSCSTLRDGLNVLRSANAGTATNTSIGISSTRAAWIAAPTIISPNSLSDADATVCSIQAVPTANGPRQAAPQGGSRANSSLLPVGVCVRKAMRLHTAIEGRTLALNRLSASARQGHYQYRAEDRGRHHSPV